MILQNSRLSKIVSKMKNIMMTIYTFLLKLLTYDILQLSKQKIKLYDVHFIGKGVCIQPMLLLHSIYLIKKGHHGQLKAHNNIPIPIN